MVLRRRKQAPEKLKGKKMKAKAIYIKKNEKQFSESDLREAWQFSKSRALINRYICKIRQQIHVNGVLALVLFT